MKRLNLLAALAFALLLCAPASGQNRVTIAGWNLGGFEPIPPARVERLARAIHNMSPHLMALSEVNPDVEVLDGLLERLEQMGDSYDYVVFEENPEQNVALLFKSSVTVTDDELIDGSDGGNPQLRKALGARVRIRNFDFFVVALHPKAGRQASDRQTRTTQARAVADWIRSKTQGAEKDVLVIGDYNMIPGQDAVNFSAMSPGPNNNEYLGYVSDALAGRTSHISGCDPLTGNLLDGFAVARAHTRELLAGSIRIVGFSDPIFRQPGGAPMNCRNYRGFISDHFPLVARFRVAGPDDD